MVFGDNVTYNIVNGGLVVTGAGLDYLHTGLITGVKDDNEWDYPNFSSIIWSVDGNGNSDADKMKIACYEHDGGSTKTINVKVTGGVKKKVNGVEYNTSAEFSHNFVINNGDDFIGEYFVNYMQDIGINGFQYHPSSDVDVQHNER